MTDQIQTSPDWAPDACTLPTAEQPLRLAEFDVMFQTAAHDPQRVAPQHLRITLTGDGSLEPAVRDLTARETECCSFFTFAVESAVPGHVQLDIHVPAAHIDVLDALQRRAALARGQQ